MLLKKRAIVLTNGLLKTADAKTAHGLIRGSERFEVVGIIDPANAGADAGELLDGNKRNILVYSNLTEALAHVPNVHCCIVGVATIGGVLPPELLVIIKEAIGHQLDIVCGLHQFLSENAEIVALAQANGVELFDVRKPKPRQELHFWTGKIYEVDALTVATFGMDTAIGKRTTARLLREACRQQGMKAEMITTGQTGWMQDGRYGFVLDSVVNDFVSGELEHWIHECWRAERPDVILVEGQAALRNPSGPCGAEYLVSGHIKHVILQHAPKRIYYDNDPKWGEIPSVASEIKLIEMYGAKVIALTLNTENCSYDEAKNFQQMYAAQLGLLVALPLEEGVESIVDVVKKIIKP